MSTLPLFSIIIPTYNRCDKVCNAIDSVLAQNFTDYELIIADDGSTDNTRKMLETYSNRLHIIAIEHGGVSKARNAGIRAGDSKYVAFLDSDDVWRPEKLMAQAGFIQSNPKIRISQTDEMWIRNGQRVNPAVKHKKRSGDIFIDSLALCLISPSAAVLERELFNEFGMFDEEMPACEDYDLWLRILAHEPVGLIENTLTIRYAGHDDQLSQRFWGMDSFRLYSIIKLLRENKQLKEEYSQAANKSAKERCEILKGGAAKRDKTEFAKELEVILTLLIHEDYSNINCQTLLAK